MEPIRNQKEAEDIVEAFLHTVDAKLRQTQRDWVSLSEPERTVVLVHFLELQVENGGLEQFFINPSGDYWRETLTALEEIDAEEIASIFKRALAVFANASPSSDHLERVDQYSQVANTAKQTLWDLDEEYYNLPSIYPTENAYYRMGAYIREIGSRPNFA